MVKGQLHGMHSGGGSPFSKLNCAEINDIASVPLGLTRVQQPVRSEWHIQDGGQL